MIHRRGTHFRSLCLVVAACHLGSLMPLALAAPNGGVVAGGSATIDQAAAGLTHIRQSSDRAIINWNGFSSTASETIRFSQPGTASVMLNRVTGGDPSVLQGRLESNGTLFLLNPNGVLFGKTSQVNVGGLVSSTLSMDDKEFMAGKYRLYQESGRDLGSVVNQGAITARNGGKVALIAPVVNNQGRITAPGGEVALAAGTNAVVQLDEQGLVNLGVSSAPKQAVMVSREAASDLLTEAAGNQNLVNAGSVSIHGNVVRLGGAEGLAVNEGTIDVSAVEGGQAGRARIESTQATVGAPGSRIYANGLGANSSGGDVLMKSHGFAYFGSNSLIEAKGGQLSGNGGYVDVSGHHLALHGDVDTSAENGLRGTFKLDPATLTITDSQPGALDPNLDNSGRDPRSILAAETAGADTVTTGKITAITASNDVILEAENHIVFQVNGALTLGPGKAGNNPVITFRTIGTSGAETGIDGSVGGGIVNTSGSTKDIVFSSAGIGKVDLKNIGIDAKGGLVSVRAGSDVTLGSTTAAGVLVKSGGDVTVGNVVANGPDGNVQIEAGGSIVRAAGNPTISAKTVGLSARNGIGAGAAQPLLLSGVTLLAAVNGAGGAGSGDIDIMNTAQQPTQQLAVGTVLAPTRVPNIDAPSIATVTGIVNNTASATTNIRLTQIDNDILVNQSIIAIGGATPNPATVNLVTLKSGMGLGLNRAGDIILSSAANANITANNGSTNGTVNLNASGKITEGTLSTVIANNVNLTAATGIGSGQGTAALQTQAAVLSVDQQLGGDAFLANDGSVTVANRASAISGSFYLQEKTGVLTVGTANGATGLTANNLGKTIVLQSLPTTGGGIVVNSAISATANSILVSSGAGITLSNNITSGAGTGNIYLLANNGAITRTAGTLTADTVYLAGAGVGATAGTAVRTAANKVALDVATGNVFLNNTGTTTIASSLGTGDIEIVNTGGSLTVGPVVVPGSGTGTLSFAGNTYNGLSTDSDSEISLSVTGAGNGLVLGGDVSTSSSTDGRVYLSAAAGNISRSAGTVRSGNVYIRGQGAGTSGGGEIVTDAEEILVDQSLGGSVAISNGLSVPGTTILANVSGSGQLDFNQTSEDLLIGAITGSTSQNGITFGNATGLTTASSSIRLQATDSSNGNIAFSENVNTGSSTNAATVFIAAPRGTVTRIGGTVTAGTILVRGNGIGSVGGAVSTATNNLVIDQSPGGNAIVTNATGVGQTTTLANVAGDGFLDFTQTAGNLTVGAVSVNTFASLTARGLTTSTKAISVAATGNIALDESITTGQASGLVWTYLTSTGGTLTRSANAVGNGVGTVTSGQVYLEANGVGTTGTHLATATSTLAVDMGRGGDVFLTNASAGVNVANRNATSTRSFALVQTGGDIRVAGTSTPVAIADNNGVVRGSAQNLTLNNGKALLSVTSSHDIRLDGNVSAGNTAYLLSGRDIQNGTATAGTVTASTVFVKAGRDVGVESADSSGHLKTATAQLGVDQSGGGSAFITNNGGTNPLKIAATGGVAGQSLSISETGLGDVTIANTTGNRFTATTFDAVSVAPAFGDITISGGGKVLLATNSGAIRMDGNVNVAGGTAYVLSGGQVVEAGSNGTLTADTLYLKATGDVGVASSTGVGHLKTSVASLGVDQSGGGSAYISNSGAGDLLVAGTGAAGTQNLAVVQTGGKLTVNTSFAPAAFDTAGTVTPFGGITMTGGTGGRVLLQTTSASADILVNGSVNAGGDIVYLLATGNISEFGSNGTVTASTVLLSAGGNIGAAGSELKTAASAIGVDATGGDVFITNAGGDVLVANRNPAAGKSFALLNTGGDITVAGATPFTAGAFDVRAASSSFSDLSSSGSAGRIFLSAAGDLTIDGSVSAVNGTAYLIATGGIQELSAASGTITAASLYLDAEGDIGADATLGQHLKTSVANLGVDSSSTGHGVYITNTGSALTVANAVDAAGTSNFAVTTTGGSLTVAGSSPFTVAAFETLATAPSLTGVTTRGGGSLLLQVTGAGSDLNLDGDVTATGGTAYLLSGGKIQEAAAGGTVTASTLYLKATGNVGVESASGAGHIKTNVATLGIDQSGGGGAFVSNSGTNDLTVAAKGLAGAQSLAVVQTGGNLTVASTAAPVAPAAFDVSGNITAFGGVTATSASGGKVLLQSNTLGKDLTVDGNVAAAGDTVYLVSGGKIVEGANGGTTSASTLYLKASGDIGAAAGAGLKTAASSIGVDAAGGDVFVTNTSGALSVANRTPTAGKAFAVHQTGDLTIAGTTAFTAATFDAISAGPSFANVATAGGGALFLNAGGNVTVDGNATAGGAGTAYVLAGGTIKEANAGSGTITAGSLYLKADGDIGAEAPGGVHLKTSVANLGVDASSTGHGVYITNTGSALKVASAVDAAGTQNFALTTTGGDLTVAGSSAFTVAAFETVAVAPILTGVTARTGGKVLLQVTGIGNDLLVDGDVSVAGGSAFLLSGGQIQEAGSLGAVTATNLYVKATESVGTEVPGEALKTHVNALGIDQSGGGSAFVTNSASGDLKFASTGAAGAQDIAVTHAGGNLVVANATTNRIAPVTFDVAGTVTPFGDVTVSSGSSGSVLLKTTSGDILVDGNVSAGGNSVYLVAGGQIQESGSNGTVTANTLFIQASGDVGVESSTGVGHLKTTVANLGVDQTGGGDAYISNSGAVLVANTGATAGQDFALVNTGGSITVAGSTPFTAAAFDAVSAQSFSNVAITGGATGGRALLSVTSAHDINQNGNVQAGLVALLAGGQIQLTGAGVVTSDTLFIKATGAAGTTGNHLRTAANTLVVDQSGGGSAFVSNTSAGVAVANTGAIAGQSFSVDQTGGDLTVAGSTPATIAAFDVLSARSASNVTVGGGSGNVKLATLSAGGDVLVDGNVTATNGSVYLVSGGDILESGTNGTITASTLYAKASGTVGGDLLSAGLHLKTAVSSLGVDQSGGGSAYITNTGLDLTVANLGATAGQDFSVENVGGSLTVANSTSNRFRANAFDGVALQQFGDVTVAHGVQPGGRVLLSARDAGMTARNLLVDGSVTATDGSVYLLANGAIRESNANGIVTADSLFVKAGGDVGADVANGLHLNTRVAKLGIDQSGGGSAFVTNNSAGLTLANSGAVNGQSLAVVQQNGNLTVANAASGRDVAVAAFDAFGTGQNLSNVTVAPGSAGGKVLLQVTDPSSGTLHDLLLDGSVSAVNGTVYLLSSGQIQEGAGLGSVTANTLLIQADGDVGKILPAGPHLDTRVANLGVDMTGGGSAYITNSGSALRVANTGAANGEDFALVQSGGDLTVAGTTAFTANAFDVVTANRSFANVSIGGASSRVLLDVTDTSAIVLEGNVTGGTVYLASGGNVTVNGTGAVSAGTLYLDAAGDVGSAANHVQTRVSSLVVDQAGGGSAFITNVSPGTAGLSVANVGGTNGQSFALKQTGGDLTVAGATPLSVAAFDALASTPSAATGLSTGHQVAQAGGSILLNSTDAKIKLDGAVTATDGTVYLLAAQAISGSGRVTADTLSILAAGDVGAASLDGSTHIQTSVANLGVDFAGGKNAFISNLTTNGTALKVANRNATAGSSFAVRQDGGDLVVANAATPFTAAAFDEIATPVTMSNITVTNGGKVLLQVTDPGGSMTPHDLLIDGNLSVATGQAYLFASDDIQTVTPTSLVTASTLFMRAGDDIGSTANHMKTASIALGIDISAGGDAFVTNVTAGTGNPGVNLSVNRATTAQSLVVQQSGGDLTVAGNTPFAIPAFDSASEVQLNDVAVGDGSTVLLQVTDTNDINVDGNIFNLGGTTQLISGGDILSTGGLGQISANTLFLKATGAAGLTSAHLNTRVANLGADQSSGGGDVFVTNTGGAVKVATTGSTGGHVFAVLQSGGALTVADDNEFHVDAFDSASAQTFGNVSLAGTASALLKVTDTSSLILKGDVNVSAGTAYLDTRGSIVAAGGLTTADKVYLRGAVMGDVGTGNALQLAAKNVVVDQSLDGSAVITNASATGTILANAAGANTLDFTQTSGALTVGQVTIAALDAENFAAPFTGIRTVDRNVSLAVTDAGATANIVLSNDLSTAPSNAGAGTATVYLTTAGGAIVEGTTTQGAALGNTVYLKGASVGTAASRLKVVASKLAVDATAGDVFVAGSGTSATVATGAILGVFDMTQAGSLTVGAVTVGAFHANAGGAFDRVTTAGKDISLAAIGGTNGVVLSSNVSTGGRTSASARISAAGTITSGGSTQGTVEAGTVLLAGRGMGTAGNRVRTSTANLAIDQAAGGDAFVAGASGATTVANRAGPGSLDVVQSGGDLSVGTVVVNTFNTSTPLLTLTGLTANQGTSNLSVATVGSGNLSFDAATSTVGTLTARSAGSLIGTATLDAVTADLGAVNGIGSAGARVNTSARSILASNSTANGVFLTNTRSSDTAVNSLFAGGSGVVDFRQSGGGSVIFGSVSTANGSVSLQNDGGSILALGGAVSVGGGQAFNATTTGGGELVLGGTVSAQGGTATLTAGGLVSTLAGNQLTANDLVINAGSGIGSSGVAVNTAVGTLNAHTTSGNAFFAQSGALASLTGIADNGQFTLASSAGDITVNSVSASGGFNVQAVNGSILKLTGSSTNFAAGNLSSSSLTALGVIGTSDAALDVNITSGSLTVSASGALNGVSVQINGSVAPDQTLRQVSTAPGLVVFNGRNLVSAVADDQTDPRNSSATVLTNPVANDLTSALTGAITLASVLVNATAVGLFQDTSANLEISDAAGLAMEDAASQELGSTLANLTRADDAINGAAEVDLQPDASANPQAGEATEESTGDSAPDGEAGEEEAGEEQPKKKRTAPDADGTAAVDDLKGSAPSGGGAE